jgi:hypothetical protein
MSSRHFFATASDLHSGLLRFEQQVSVLYVLTGLHDCRSPEVRVSGGAIPNLGQAPSGHAISEPSFLVLRRTTTLVVREVPQRHGGVKFAIDQLANPDSTVFWPGGLFAADVLISGRIATTGTTDAARQLQQLMVRTVTKGFRKVGTFWLGPEAAKMWESGARLTMAVQMPPDCDLRPEAAG